MARPADLPPELRAAVRQLALHEAGHAVAAIVLGFELRAIRFSDDGIGETDTSAGDLSPDSADGDLLQKAVVVAG